MTNETITPDDLDRLTTLIAEHKLPLCRARLLHILSAAIEQGTLLEVLDEVIDYGEGIHIALHTHDKIARWLREHGWLR